MKKTKTLVPLVAAALIVALASVIGTVAYLTDSSEVVNTFTVGEVEIKLDEAKTDRYGKPDGNTRTEDGNSYHLVPSMTYTKDPTVTVVAGGEESFVRCLVTITSIDELKSVFGLDPFLPQNFVKGWDPNIWITTGVITDNADNSATYEFRYHKSVIPSESTDTVLEPLFTSFTVPADLDGAALEKLSNLEIKVEAHAIQSAGFATEADAWAAFRK